MIATILIYEMSPMENGRRTTESSTAGETGATCNALSWRSSLNLPLDGASPMFEGDATLSYHAPTAWRAQKILVDLTMRDEAAEPEIPWMSVSFAGSLSMKTKTSLPASLSSQVQRATGTAKSSPSAGNGQPSMTSPKWTADKDSRQKTAVSGRPSKDSRK